MKRYAATLLLIFALLASGCNEQEPKNVTPVQTENNTDKPITPPKEEDSNSEEMSNGNGSPDIQRNSREEIRDGEINNNDDKTSSISQSNEQEHSQSNPQISDQSNPQISDQSNPQISDQSNPQISDQSNPQISDQSNPQTSDQSNPSVEPVKPPPPPPPPPSFLEENMIPIMVGMAIVIVLLTIAVFVQTNKLKRKKISPIPPTVSPEPNKPSESPNSTVSSLPPPTFASNDNQTSSSKRLAFLVGTLHNIGKREEQQDSFCVSNSRDEQALSQKGLMAVVADGMGGLEGGAKISKLVTNTFLQSYTRQAVPSTANFLYNTAATAEKEVDKFIEREGITGGSTLVAIMIKNYELNFISVGDSHIYLFQNGILTQRNREHNYGEVLKEKYNRGEVSYEEAYRNSQRHSLTAYIGMGSFNIVDKNSHPIPLKPGDKVFLCSDGVYNALGNDALATLLKSDALTAAKKIEANILSQNLPKQDNFTGVIVELYEK